jgi:dynein heavy chain
MSLVADLELNDKRVEFVADYVLKTFKLKPDKWMKLYNVEESKTQLLEFFDKQENLCLVVTGNSAGVLALQYEWPNSVKHKAVYFVKKNKENVQKDGKYRDQLLYGDLSNAPMDQLSAYVDEVSIQCIRTMLALKC